MEGLVNRHYHGAYRGVHQLSPLRVGKSPAIVTAGVYVGCTVHGP